MWLHSSPAAMGSGGPGRLTALGLLAAAALVAAAAVKPAASSPAAASSEEEASGGGGMYMVPHLGNNPVLGPVTGAPPGKLTNVPLSAPSVSVRSKDDSVTQRRLPEKRSVIEPAGRDGDYDFHQRLGEAAERHPHQRKPRLDSSELSQFMLGSPTPKRKLQRHWHDRRQRMRELTKRPLHR